MGGISSHISLGSVTGDLHGGPASAIAANRAASGAVSGAVAGMASERRRRRFTLHWSPQKHFAAAVLSSTHARPMSTIGLKLLAKTNTCNHQPNLLRPNALERTGIALFIIDLNYGSVKWTIHYLYKGLRDITNRFYEFQFSFYLFYLFKVYMNCQS